jgi:tetratricopeptide (TPR) repeat protein
MNADLFARLSQAQTEEEKTWLLIELSLEGLLPELRQSVWAMALPHWFDAEILAAACPDLADRAAELYQQLQGLSFVEVFPERGHNVHELTRRAILQRRWQDDRQGFVECSGRLAAYFANVGESAAEWIYHLVIADREQGKAKLKQYAETLNNSYRRSESELLLSGLREHLAAGWLEPGIAGRVAYWEGRLHFRFYEASQALERYETAIEIYRQVGDRLGEANTLQAIGDVLQFLDQRQAALERYETAIEIYRQVGARLGEANTLQAIGDVLQFLDQRQAALERYETAIEIYRQVGARLGEANTLQAIGDLQSDPAVAMAQYLQPALSIYQQIDNTYSQGRILAVSIAPTYLKLQQPDQAKLSYEQALELSSQINYQPGIQYCQNALRDLDGISD